MLSFVPDEEIGGVDGMQKLIEMGVIDTSKFEVAFDEGLANPSANYTVFYGERKPKWVKITAKGNLLNQATWGTEVSS